MEIKVIKKDGSKEDYQENKIARVAKVAGLSFEEAQTLAAKITQWVRETHPLEVTSLQIRDKMVEELQKVNQYAADLFVWYGKTKEKKTEPVKSE